MLSGGDVKSRIGEMKERVDRLNQEKASLMTEHNYKIDYMDIMYDCPLCKDTGIQDTGDRCVCFAEKLAAMQKTD
jgi:DNA replication protein DnaC